MVWIYIAILRSYQTVYLGRRIAHTPFSCTFVAKEWLYSDVVPYRFAIRHVSIPALSMCLPYPHNKKERTNTPNTPKVYID
jgi:hypothetical protein